MTGDLKAQVKRNILKRLAYLDVTSTDASRRAGHYKTWLYDQWRRDGGIQWLESIAVVLGVEPWELMLSDKWFRPDRAPVPKWME